MQIRNYFSNNPNKDFFVFAGVLVLVVGVASASLLWWQNYNDPVRQQQALLEDYQRQVEDAYRNDTYGGSTPEETLRLFVEALKKEDIELASKYFALDDDLGRDKWIELLANVKSKGVLNKFASDISQYDESKTSFGPYHLFMYRNEDDTLALQITMVLNSVSRVWKIESL